MRAGRLFLGFLAFLLVAALAGGVYLQSYLNDHRDLLELGVSKVLDREVRIEDGATLHWSLTPAVALKGLWIGNPDWAAGAYFARTDDAVLRFDLVSLLSGHFRVTRVTLLGADVRLETAQDGRYNWYFGGEGGGAATIGVDILQVEDSSLHYHSPVGTGYVLAISELILEQQDPGKLVIEGDLKYQDIPLSLSGSERDKAGSVDAVRTFALQVESRGAALDISGDYKGARGLSRLQLELHSERLDLREWLTPFWPTLAFDGSLKGLRARVSSSGDTPDSLIRNAKGELKLASAVLKPRAISGSGTGELQIRGLSTQLEPDAAVKLRTELVYAGQSFQVSLRGGTLAKLIAEGKSWRGLQLEAVGTLNDRPVEIGGELGPWNAKRTTLGVDLILRDERLRVTLNGDLAPLKALRGSRLALTASAPSLSHLTPWLGVPMPDSAPFDLSAKFRGDEHHLKLEAAKLTTGGSDVSGTLRIPLKSGERLEAELKSRVLDLRPFLPEPDEGGGGFASMLETELPPDALAGINGTLRFEAERVLTGSIELRTLKLDTALHQQHLKLAMLSEDEQLSIDGELRPSGDSWQLVWKQAGEQTLGALVDRVRPADVSAKPPMEMALTLTASGKSMAQMLDSANGQFVMVLGAGELNRRFSPNLPLGDVLLTLLDTISGDEEKGTPKLECAVIQLDIDQGIATSSKGLAMRTEKMNILGGGAMKLRSGEIDLRFKTASRKGLGINLLGIAGRLVRLTGTLKKPEVAVDVGGAVTYGAATWATGGLTLVYDTVFARLTASSNPCDDVSSLIE